MRRVKRNWGWMITFFTTKTWWVKYLHTPRARLSEQYHKHRSEVHIGLCRIRKEHLAEFHALQKAWFLTLVVGSSETFQWHIGIWYVKPKMIHRLQFGYFLEVVWGESGKVTEDDIVRTKDDFGRT